MKKFGGKRKSWRESQSKIPVFGLLKREWKVYTKIFADASFATLITIIEQMVIPDDIVYTGSWKSYKILDFSDVLYFRINRSILPADKNNHINGVENFWKQKKNIFVNSTAFLDHILCYTWKTVKAFQ